MSSETLYYVVGAIVAIGGLVFVMIKFRPEDTKVYIESADRLVGMANSVAEMSESAATDLRERNKILDDRVTELSEKFGEAVAHIELLQEERSRMTELEHKVSDLVRQLAVTQTKLGEAEKKVAELERNLAKELEEKARIEKENEDLRKRVTELETEVATLKAAR